MGLFDLTLGTILIASWANAALCAVQLTQLVTYFRRFPRDALWNRIPVITSIVADVATSVAILVYGYTISHFGDLAYAQRVPWTQGVYLIGTGLSALTCQTFLVIRIYRLTSKAVWLFAFAPAILAGFAGSIGMAIFLTIFVTLSERPKITIMVTLWTCSSAATDILISLALVMSLRRVHTDFVDTHGLIRKLTTRGISSGVFSATIASLVFLCFKILPETNLGTMWGMVLGRVYSITLLFNLNSRSELNSENDATPHRQSDSRDMMGTRSNKVYHSSSKGGVQVSQERTIVVEDAVDLPELSRERRNPFGQPSSDDLSIGSFEMDKESQTNLVFSAGLARQPTHQ